ncbi:MAG: helix-turn-helix domain-containing protein [Pseudomonadota bacterium]
MQKTLRPTTKDAIIEAAFDVFSRDQSAPLSAIADRAGVGRATLHRHFASREELIRDLAFIAIEEMDAAAEAAFKGAASYADAFRNMLKALIPLGNRHGFLAKEPLENDEEIAVAFARQQRDTRDIVETAKGEGMFDPNIPTDWITQVFDHLLYAAWESVKSGEATQSQAADLAWRTFISGLGGPKI